MHIHLNHKIPNSSLTCGDLSHICQYSRTNSWDDVRWMLHSMRFSIAILHWSKRIVLLIFLPITDNITNWTWILTSSIIRILWNQCCISNCKLYTTCTCLPHDWNLSIFVFIPMFIQAICEKPAEKTCPLSIYPVVFLSINFKFFSLLFTSTYTQLQEICLKW